MSKFFVLALLLFAQHHQVLSYKPVVIIHGILDTAASMNDLKLMIEKAHPSTNVTVIKLYPEVESIFTPMWDQINGVSEVLEEIMAQSKDGIHLIGFSQGISNYMRSIMSFMRHIFLSFKGNIYS
jgi:palmitoyl-protein thioesterase